MIEIFEGFEEVKGLLDEVLKMLVEDGPFERTALLVISPEEKKAVPILHSKLCDSLPHDVQIDNPLSPLLNLSSKVVSCARQKSNDSPFDSGTFALAPLDVKHDRPVALYADCGRHKVLNFEARRLFRRAVDLLNHMLPDMEGDLPPIHCQRGNE